VAITNEPGSLLAESAKHVIELRTGEERSVAATKTYTASLGAVAALVGLAASYVVAGGPGRAWAAPLLQAVLPVAAAAPVAFSLVLQNAL
jgi:hypothetical protein